MTKSAQDIALFYFFSFLDEHLVMELAAQAFELFQEQILCLQKEKNKLKKKQSPTESSQLVSQSELNSTLVSSTYRIWMLQKKKKITSIHEFTHLNIKWKMPNRSSLEPWREFLKFSNGDDQVLFLIWTNILKIPICDISNGLSITEGTVRFKLSRGLHNLSEFVYFGDNNTGVIP